MVVRAIVNLTNMKHKHGFDLTIKVSPGDNPTPNDVVSVVVDFIKLWLEAIKRECASNVVISSWFNDDSKKPLQSPHQVPSRMHCRATFFKSNCPLRSLTIKLGLACIWVPTANSWGK